MSSYPHTRLYSHPHILIHVTLISSYDLTQVFEEEGEEEEGSKDGSEKLSRAESSKSFDSFGEEVLISTT